MTTGIILPAHMGSTRFPGKPLAMVGGKPLLSYAVEAAKASGMPWCVATSNHEIANWCDTQGMGTCIIGGGSISSNTSKISGIVVVTNECRNGTERAALVNGAFQFDRVIVLQCDEPDVTGEDLLELERRGFLPSTLVAEPLETDIDNFNSVIAHAWKCRDGHLIRCFTRSAPQDVFDGTAYRHVGVYCYHKYTLETYLNLQPVEAEVKLSLEQLRITQICAWYAVCLNRTLRSVNVPEDVNQFKEDGNTVSRPS